MSNKNKSQIKEEALDLLQELVMSDIFSTYNIINIEKCVFKPEYIIRVPKDNFKNFLNILIDCGITFLHYEELSEIYMGIFILDEDIYKLTNEKIKRLHDCIEYLYK